MNSLHRTLLMLSVLLLGVASNSPASEQQELLQLKNTVLNLVDALVAQGVLDKGQAATLVAKAEADATRQAAALPAAAERQTAPPAPVPEASGKTVVRVPYVPEFVKEELRSQLRAEMRRDVLADVTEQARKEKWGTPGALPGWISAVKLYGDARVRNEFDRYGEGNAETLGGKNLYLNVLNVNKAGSIAAADTRAFLNTSEDQNRWRERLRLGLTAKIAERWSLDTRMVTGNADNPVSANLTLGNSAQRFTVQLDRAQLRFDETNAQGFTWLSAAAGRITNPWFSTELLWDDDLGFDGIALTVRKELDSLLGEPGFDAFAGDRKAWLTAGAFPLQQPEFVSQDRWLLGGQLGADWEFENQNKLKVAAAFYDYLHIPGQRNSPFSTRSNGTAPQFLQKGNLLFNIANDPSDPNKLLFALASDYRLLDFNVAYDFANLAPYHVILNAEVVKNIGFDSKEITRRTGGLTYLYPIEDRTLGFLAGIQFGWPEVSRLGAWSVAFDYRYLQRDAVLDAFTDSDFHLGGTDTQGYRITGLFGLTRNLWLRGRWMSATEIDGPPLTIDVLQVDLNAKF